MGIVSSTLAFTVRLCVVKPRRTRDVSINVFFNVWMCLYFYYVICGMKIDTLWIYNFESQFSIIGANIFNSHIVIVTDIFYFLITVQCFKFLVFLYVTSMKLEKCILLYYCFIRYFLVKIRLIWNMTFYVRISSSNYLLFKYCF